VFSGNIVKLSADQIISDRSGERNIQGADLQLLQIFCKAASGAYPVLIEGLILLNLPLSEGMQCTAGLGSASDTGLCLFAVELVFIAQLAEDMHTLAAFPVMTSHAFLALHAGVLIRIMPLSIFVTQKSAKAQSHGLSPQHIKENT